MSNPKKNIDTEAAYETALRKIESCRHAGNRGTDLNLSGLNLMKLPPEIGNLTWLKSLDLSLNQLGNLPVEIGELDSLNLLNLSHNLLISLPAQIGKLTDLTSLDLSLNQLGSLPTEIGELKSLNTLNLSHNLLTTLPARIGQLSDLTSLDLGWNHFHILPKQICKLRALTELNLSGNQLSSLPEDIGNLDSMKDLKLWDNQLGSLPTQIGHLTQLLWLDLSQNKLSSLPEDIGNLVHLIKLDIHHNRVTRLPKKISNLKHLEHLILENNDLRELPTSLSELENLQELTLHYNTILEIPTEVLGPPYSISNNVRNPPASPKKILDFYFAQKSGPKQPLNEVKVLVVGETAVGKTSLIRQLRGEVHNPKEEKTHGIERHQLDMNCGRLGMVRLNVWDFGGQDIMHATHQFFFTHRSVYILVLDSRQNERQTRMDYWLKLIAAYGGDSPVIIVCNKADQQVMQLNWTGLGRDNQQIKGFAKEVCCYHSDGNDRRKGLDELRQLIAQTVEQHVAEVDQPLLITWLKLKNDLETDARPYLSLEEYHLMAAERGIKTQKDREELLSLMHRLGSVLHFSEHAIFEKDRASNATPAHVEELNVLDPGWVTSAIYKLLNDAELMRVGGRMNRGSMKRSLSELEGYKYPSSKQEFIIAMMRRFEICFAFDGATDEWLLPDLLHKDEVDTGNWQGAMSFRYKYQVLPGSIFIRLMVRLHHHIAKHCLWPTGAKFNRAPCEALVRSDMENASVDIQVRGGNKIQRQLFLALIRGTLEDIHSSFSGHLGVEEQLPMPTHPDVYVDYERLLLLEDKGTTQDEVKVNGKLEGIDISAILNQVTQRSQRNIEREQRRPKDEIKHGLLNKAKTVQFNGPVHIGNLTKHDHSTHTRDITNSQVAHTLQNCQNVIHEQAHADLKPLLESLTNDVKALIARLPEDKQEEAAINLELLTKAVARTKPNRIWYSVSSEGLLEASKFVKDFTGNIASTLGQIGKLVWSNNESA